MVRAFKCLLLLATDMVGYDRAPCGDARTTSAVSAPLVRHHMVQCGFLKVALVQCGAREIALVMQDKS